MQVNPRAPPPESSLARPLPPPPNAPTAGPFCRGAVPPRDLSIMRSSQLDAARLDEELSSMLREQFLRAFALFRPAAVARLQPELTLLLDFLVGGLRGGPDKPAAALPLSRVECVPHSARHAVHPPGPRRSSGSLCGRAARCRAWR